MPRAPKKSQGTGSSGSASTETPHKRCNKATRVEKPYDRIQSKKPKLSSSIVPTLATIATAEAGGRKLRETQAVRFKSISLGCYLEGCPYTCANVKNPVNSLNSHLDYWVKKGHEPHIKAMRDWKMTKQVVERKEILMAELKSLGEVGNPTALKEKVMLRLESLKDLNCLSKDNIPVIRKRKTKEMVRDVANKVVALTMAGPGVIKTEVPYDDTQDAEGDVDEEYFSGLMALGSLQQWTVPQDGELSATSMFPDQYVGNCMYGDLPVENTILNSLSPAIVHANGEPLAGYMLPNSPPPWDEHMDPEIFPHSMSPYSWPSTHPYEDLTANTTPQYPPLFIRGAENGIPIGWMWGTHKELSAS